MFHVKHLRAGKAGSQIDCSTYLSTKKAVIHRGLWITAFFVVSSFL